MINRSVAVLSGISTRVVDGFVQQLNSNGVGSAFVKASTKGFDADYFERLLSQVFVMIGRARERSPCLLTIVLVSCIRDPAELALERSAFFPAVRRLGINPEWRNNPDAARRIADTVLRHIQSQEEKDFLKTISVRGEARLLLPVFNTKCKALLDQFSLIYAMESRGLSNRVNREVVSLRGKRVYRVRGVDFAPVVNNEQHPIRRCSATKQCDLAALFRFGSAVPERMEFDVSCEDGLRKKVFHQCDGTSGSTNIQSTHVNMRINDDFIFA